MAASIAESEQGTQSPVVIVGGGVVGIATAIHAQRNGKQVTLIDKSVSEEDRASFGNAGVLASSSVLPVTMPGLLKKIPKMVLSKREPLFIRWPYFPRLLPWVIRYIAHANVKDVKRIASALEPIIGSSLESHLELSQGTSAQRHIKPCDFAFLYQDRAAFQGDSLAWQIRKDLGFHWNEYDATQRESYDTVFSDDLTFMAALTGHGQITDPGAYIKDLRSHFIESGGCVVDDTVTDISHAHGNVTGVVTESGQISAQSVVITAGAWSPLVTNKLGLKIPVEAESGYHLEFWNPSFSPRTPTLVPTKKLIFSPMKGRLRVAGAVEFGGLDNQGQEQAFENLRNAVKETLPELRYDKETQWIGHRPAPTDSVPVIDELEHIKGVFLGFGHQHVGLTGSARTGEILAQLVCGQRPDINLHPYRASRFHGPLRERGLAKSSA